MNKLSPNCDAACECCLMNPQTCEVLRAGVQKLMDQWVVLLEHLSGIEEVVTLEIPYDQT